MKLVLREDIDGLGDRGAVVTVKAGYARNYLLPQKKAMPYSEANVRQVEAERRIKEARLLQQKGEAETLAASLAAVELTVAKKVGESQELYGAVTAAEVSEKLTEKGFEIDKKLISFTEPIKSLGMFDVPVDLFPGVTATVKVWVVKE